MKDMKDFRLLLIVFLLSFVLTTALAGCATAPQYEVDSLEELKESLADYPHILFPDLKPYEEFPYGRYTIPYTGRNSGCSSKRVLVGYEIQLGAMQSESTSVLEGIDLSCLDNGLSNKGTNPEDLVLIANMDYRGISIQDLSEKRDFEEYADIYTMFPEDSYFYRYNYAFDYLGCRYSMGGELILPPGELTEGGVNAVREKGKREFLDLIDSIIEQGG